MKMRKINYKQMLEHTKYTSTIYRTERSINNLLLAIDVLKQSKIISYEQMPCYSVNSKGLECKYYMLNLKHKQVILAVGTGVSNKFEYVSNLQISRIERKSLHIFTKLLVKDSSSMRHKLATEFESILSIVF